jgi:hypothetical protein
VSEAVQDNTVELTLNVKRCARAWEAYELLGFDHRAALELALASEPNLTDAERDEFVRLGLEASCL